MKQALFLVNTFKSRNFNRNFNFSPSTMTRCLPRGREYEQTQGKFISRHRRSPLRVIIKEQGYLIHGSLLIPQLVNRCYPDNVSNNSRAISPRHFMSLRINKTISDFNEISRASILNRNIPGYSEFEFAIRIVETPATSHFYSRLLYFIRGCLWIRRKI